MEKSNSISLSSNSIKNILTLRYNLSINPIRPKLTEKDFISTRDNFSTEFIEEMSAVGPDAGNQLANSSLCAIIAMVGLFLWTA